MQVDLNVLRQKLNETPQEETVDSTEVNPYLLNEVLRPLLAGKELRYGDIDYSRFEADDLRMIAHYCDIRDRVICRLNEFVGGIADSAPSACSGRSFC